MLLKRRVKPGKDVLIGYILMAVMFYALLDEAGIIHGTH